MANRKKKITSEALFWSHFDETRTHEMGGNVAPLHNESVSVSVPAGSSHREVIEHFARAAKPVFGIVSLSARLDDTRYIRGRGYLGQIGRNIDGIVDNYPGMRWWMETGGGLSSKP